MSNVKANTEKLKRDKYTWLLYPGQRWWVVVSNKDFMEFNYFRNSFAVEKMGSLSEKKKDFASEPLLWKIAFCMKNSVL